MKAITYTRYGSPEVLQLAEVEQPTTGANDVLVRVCAASVNAYDWRYVRADPFLVRLIGGLFRPKNQRLGADIAGRVEAVGSAVTHVQPTVDMDIGEREEVRPLEAALYATKGWRGASQGCCACCRRARLRRPMKRAPSASSTRSPAMIA